MVPSGRHVHSTVLIPTRTGNMEFITPNSIDGLVSKLGFPKSDGYAQDWECEVSDHTRIQHWLGEYQRSDLNEEERYTLMKVIIESINDALSLGSVDGQTLATFKGLVVDDYHLHSNTLDDWDQEGVEESHVITPIIRKIVLEAKT